MDSGVMELADQISAIRAGNKRLRKQITAEFELPLAREITGDLNDETQNGKVFPFHGVVSKTEPEMTFIGQISAARYLLCRIMLQAIEDYVKLKACGAIQGDEVDHSRWFRVGKSKQYKRPLGFLSSVEAEETIKFLEGPGLELLCAVLGKPACRIRKRIGITPGSNPVLTVEEIARFVQLEAESNR